MSAVQTALGLSWLLLWAFDQRREPAMRRMQLRSFLAWSIVLGLWFVLTGLWWIVRGLGD